MTLDHGAYRSRTTKGDGTQSMRKRTKGMTEHSLLITVENAAELLSIGKSKAWELVAQGKIPTIKLGKRRLVLRRGLEQLVETLAMEQ